MKIAEVYQLWIKEKKHFVKRSSISAYILIVENHILPNFGECEDINEDHVQRFVLDKIESGISQKTVRDILIVLKMIAKYGKKKQIFDFKEWEVEYPTGTTKEYIQVLTIAEHKKAIEYVKDHITFRNIGILICLSSGLRIGEVCGLKFGDIDMDNQMIYIRRTIQRVYNISDGERKTELIIDVPKTKNSVREIPLTKDLVNILKHLMKVVNMDYFVLTNELKPTEPRTYRAYYKRLMQEIGLPVIKFHSLRHSFATRCIESKADYKTVSVILGHANINTTLNLYVHPNAEQKKATINNVFKRM